MVWFTFLYASHTRIISCKSLPSGVVLGTISQNTRSNFLMVWSWRGSTKRMIVIRSPGSFSPFRIIMITFFKASVFDFTSPFSYSKIPKKKKKAQLFQKKISQIILKAINKIKHFLTLSVAMVTKVLTQVTRVFHLALTKTSCTTLYKSFISEPHDSLHIV